MSVVMRCPNCGTVQGHAGECDACSEAAVQYFCTNHDEGSWLDGPVCDRCGAKFGDAPKTSAPKPSRPAARPAGAPDFRAPVRRRAEPRPEHDFGARPSRRPAPDEATEAEVLPETDPFAEWLEDIAEARARGRVADRPEEAPWGGPPVRAAGFPVVGCLTRILGLGLLLFLAFVLFLSSSCSAVSSSVSSGYSAPPIGAVLFALIGLAQ